MQPKNTCILYTFCQTYFQLSLPLSFSLLSLAHDLAIVKRGAKMVQSQYKNYVGLIWLIFLTDHAR